MNSFLLFFQRHPRLKRPVINFEMALILSPVMVLGTTLGQYVNAFFPELVASIAYMIFLLTVTPILGEFFPNFDFICPRLAYGVHKGRKGVQFDLRVQTMRSRLLDHAGDHARFCDADIGGGLLLFESAV